MPMRAGKLRHEIVIEEVARTPDDYGQQIPTWSTFTATYAHIKHLRGNELLVAKQVNGDIDTEITTRWVSGLRIDMRIKAIHDSLPRYYNIVNINTLNEIEETLVILCKRLENNING